MIHYTKEGKEPYQDAIIEYSAMKSTKSLLEGDLTIEQLTLHSETYTEKLSDGSTIEWVLPHSKRFPDFINSHFGENPEYRSKRSDFIDEILKAMKNADGDSPPFAYQKFIRDYLRFGTPYRSLLLEHGLGSGKSRSAILVAETFRKQGLRTIIMTPAFLRLNFMDEIKKWGDSDIRITDDTPEDVQAMKLRKINMFYNFVHYNATGYGIGKKDKVTGDDISGKNSLFEQLARIGIGFPKGSKYGNLFPYINRKYGNLEPPKNMLIIIEEIHGMNRSFTKGDKTLRYYMYPLLMMATNCKIIGLSGTPIVGSPFEMSTLYNVLRGPLPDGGTALPQSEKEFNDLFVNYDQLEITNSRVMMQRIIGLGSMFKGITDDEERIIYPSGKDDPKIIELFMSDYQSTYHDKLYDAEIEKRISGKRKLVSISGASSAKMSQAQAELEPPGSYFMTSRQACNFVFPRDIPRPRKKTSDEIKKMEDIDDYIFEFAVGGKKIDDADKLQIIYDSIVADNISILGYEQAFKDAVKDGDLDKARVTLTDLIKVAYDNNPHVKSKHYLWKFLSKDDRFFMKKNFGTYAERLESAIHELAKNADKYFTMNALLKYTAKMENIYRSIISDEENGAAVVKYDEKPIELSDQESDEYYDDTIDMSVMLDQDVSLEGEDDGDIDVKLASKVRVNPINDPDDPFNQKKYQDVYLPDSEINGRVVGGPALVYSFFNTVEGVGIFSKVLEAHGFTEFTDDTISRGQRPDDVKRAPRYAFVKGGMSNDLKAKIMRVFNSKANAHGQLIRVIFVTQAAAEGISLFSLRQIHIMEPFWDNTMIEQVIGRGFRLKSHQYLQDKDERRIQIYRYYSKTSVDRDPKHTADFHVQGIADKKDVFLKQLKKIRASAAVDCVINSDYNKLDVPCFSFHGDTSGLAFHQDIIKDIKETKTLKQVVKDRDYSLVEVAGGQKLIYFNNLAKIEITKKDGSKRAANVYITYKITTDWKEGDPIDKSSLVKYGYLTTHAGQKKLINLDPKIKEI